MKSVLLFLFSAFALVGSAQNSFNSYEKESTAYREHALDIIKMKLEVSFEPQKGLVNAKVTHQFKVLQKRVDSVFFDGLGIEIKEATYNGGNLPYKIVPTGIWVIPRKALQWDEQGEIVFTYTAKPKRGIYFIGWNVPEPKISDPFAVRKQIWTQGQGIDNRQWIPMYDDMNDKFITETVTTFDKNYEVLSNGKLLSKKANKDGTNTWHYAMSKPHAGYLLMLGIGKYAVATAKSKRGVPLQFWYYPEFADRMEPTFKHSAMMVDFLEEQTGMPFPWESYSQIMVQDFLYGAMENTTATVFGDFFNVDSRAFLDRNYIGVNCHELTHQWFGDFITAREVRDSWLQESFATYFPKQLSKVLDGEDEYNWQKRAHQNAAIDAGKRDNIAIRITGSGTARIYQKGSAVISMLAYVLGEDQWKRVLTHYLRTHAYVNVETNDLQQAIKDVLGLNLDWFFDEWILRGGEPHYRVHYEELTYDNGTRGLEIAIAQIHKMSEVVRAFKMPVNMEVYFSDGSKISLTENIEKDFEVIKVNNIGNKKIAFVLFDPNSNLLKQITFHKTFNELNAQLNGAPFLLDRYDALVAMRNLSMEIKRESLYGVIAREKYEGILNEAITQLCLDRTEKSLETLKKLASYPKAIVRDQVLKSLAVNDATKTMFMGALKDSSYDVVKTALEKLCLAFPGEAGSFLGATESVHGMFHVVRMKWLELSILNGVNVEKAKGELIDYSSNAYEFRTRGQAFLVLKSTGLCTEKVIANLFQAMLSANGRLAGPAAEAANYFCLNTQNRELFRAYFRDAQFSETEKEILTKSLLLLKHNN
ncbi:MAG: M1 family metallopeptidase [bacterium]|nr:M1 family metallopeptidase [bacterium]